MAYYNWKGIYPNGQLAKGQLKANDRREVINKIHDNHITPFYIKRIFFTFSTIPTIYILSFIRELALLLQTNVPLTQALSVLSQSEKNLSLKDIITQINKAIISGSSLYHALTQFPLVFSRQMLAFIQSGENTARLSQSLIKLSQLLESQQKIKNQLKKALSYPLFLLICTLLISIGIMFYIIPKYQSFFNELGGRLPKLTVVLLNLTLWLQQHIFILGFTLMLTIIILVIIFQQPKAKLACHQLMLKLPVTKSLALLYAISQWSYLLSMSAQTGIPLLGALALANKTITNKAISIKLNQILPSLQSGETLHTCLAKTKLFPQITLKMILIGETTGTLGHVFSTIAEDYQSRLTEYLSSLVKRAEPMIMLVIAALTGLLITALYLPMINLGLNV